LKINGGGRGGILETEKPCKKSPKTAKPQEISSKTKIKALTNKLWWSSESLFLLFNFYMSKLVLLSEVLSAYYLVSAEHIVQYHLKVFTHFPRSRHGASTLH